MNKKALLLPLLVFTFLSSCATQNGNENHSNISPKSEVNTGSYFIEICTNPRSPLCVAFVSGYLMGQASAIEDAKDYEIQKEKACKNGPQAVCIFPISKAFEVTYYGCNMEVSTLTWDQIIALVRTWVEGNPERLKNTFASNYMEAMKANFPCKK